MNELSAVKIAIKAARTLMDEQATTICAMAQDEFALTARAIFNSSSHTSGITEIFFKIFKFIRLAISLTHLQTPEANGLSVVLFQWFSQTSKCLKISNLC